MLVVNNIVHNKFRSLKECIREQVSLLFSFQKTQVAHGLVAIMRQSVAGGYRNVEQSSRENVASSEGGCLFH